ncbi:hypothetical protein FGO68_gene2577 [Halteria grandinella]|uniref:Uncharacterized protein n=1 Tax=Halteria grandinella TaxID=5974 RepID=A0A8J8NZU8_HALGN|nr:hypothetical protein FGO68_gene2577 [Halteria grandinella]
MIICNHSFIITNKMNFLWGSSSAKPKPQSNMTPEQQAHLQEMVRQHIERLQAQGIAPPGIPPVQSQQPQPQQQLVKDQTPPKLTEQSDETHPKYSPIQEAEEDIIEQATLPQSEPSSISTTAGGDGLEFDRSLPSIFDEIQEIKGISAYKSQELAQKPDRYTVNDDEGLTLSMVESIGLQPNHIIIEVINGIEALKSEALQVNEKEREYLTVLKKLRRNEPIQACSFTLALLMDAWQQTLSDNQKLQEEIQSLKADQNTLLEQCNQMKIDRGLMSQQLIGLHKEYEIQQGDVKRLESQIERFKRQRDEQSKIQSEDAYKQVIDNGVYREKIDQLKLEMHQLKKRVTSTEKFEQMYYEVKEKLKAREQDEAEEELRRKRITEEERCSIIGHLKNLRSSNNQTLFSLETSNFLEFKDIIKLQSISRQVREKTFSANQKELTRQFCNHSLGQKSQINQLRGVIINLETQIRRFEEKDSLRKAIVQDTSESRMRYILEKHVVKPRILQQDKLSDLKREEMPLRAIDEMAETIKGVIHFMGKYFESVKQVQLAQRNKQLQQQLVRQQTSQSQNENGQKSASSGSQKPIGYNIMKTGKKLVGALSYFGAISGSGASSQSTTVSELPEQPQEEAKSADLLGMEEQNQQQSETSSNSGQDQQKYEPTKLTQQLASIEELRKFEDNTVAYDHIDVDCVPVQQETLQSLDSQITSVEEMNEFLYKIGCCFVGNKSQLAQWIKGTQEAFAHLFVVSKALYLEAQELEALKDFLVKTVENLKQRVHDLVNEKEDLSAMHQSDSGVKEHLLERVNDLEKINMERSTELIYIRRTLQELQDERGFWSSQSEEAAYQVKEVKLKCKKDVQLLKEHTRKLSDENKTMQRALLNMQNFFKNFQEMEDLA